MKLYVLKKILFLSFLSFFLISFSSLSLNAFLDDDDGFDVLEMDFDDDALFSQSDGQGRATGAETNTGIQVALVSLIDCIHRNRNDLAQALQECQGFFDLIPTGGGGGGVPAISPEVIRNTAGAVFREPDSGRKLTEIFDAIRARGTITQPIWERTYSPKGRNALYFPLYKIRHGDHSGCAVNFFYNQASNMTMSGEGILDVEEVLGIVGVEDSLSARLLALGIKLGLESASAVNPDQFPNQVATLLPLFSALKIQERRFGIFLHAGFDLGKWLLEVESTAQIAERNFILNKKEIRTARDVFKELFAGVSSGGSGLSVREFFKVNVGFGDTNIKLGRKFFNSDDIKLTAGPQVILPTSKIDQRPTLRSPASTTAGLNIFKQSSIDQLRSVRDYLLDAQLGNGGHWGLGVFGEGSLSFCKGKVKAAFRASYDKLFAASEDRLLLQRQTTPPSELISKEFVEALICDQPIKLPSQADAISPFITLDRLVDQFVFPSPYRVRVIPGGIFNSLVSLSFLLGKHTWTIGYDYYSQGAERIDRVYNSFLSPADFRLDRGESPLKVQHKIFGSLFKKKHF